MTFRRGLGVAAVISAALVSWRCSPSNSGTTTPTGPTTPSSTALSIVGNVVLTAVGQTSQLAVETTAGTPFSGAVTWTSSSPGVVAISPAGQVTAVSLGHATIAVSGMSASGTTTAYVVSTTAPGGTTVVNSCRVVTSPGSYALAADLSGTSSGCLTFGPVANAQLDCQGHAIESMTMQNTSGVSIANCVIGNVLDVEQSTNVTIDHSTAQAGVFMRNVNGAMVTNTTINAPRQYLDVVLSSGVQVVKDVIVATNGTAGVSFTGGSGNQVLQTTITGGYDGGAAEVGADDGVVIYGESNDTISGNTISNVFDAGIETVGSVSGLTIADNTITNVGQAAIAAYFCTSWTQNVVRNNHASTVSQLLDVTYNIGSQCAGFQGGDVFVNNTVVGNVFRNPIVGTALLSPTAPAARMTIRVGTASGNLLQDNDFGANDGPFLLPLEGFRDGGGNVCAPTNIAVSNFACTGTSAQRGRVARRGWR